MPRGVTVTSICVTTTAVAFLVLDITGAADRWNIRAQVGDHDLTIIAAVSAVVLWIMRWRQQQRDPDKALLIRTLADAVPAQRQELAKTLPLRRVL